MNFQQLKPSNTIDGFYDLMKRIHRDELLVHLKGRGFINADDQIVKETNFFAKLLDGDIPNYPNPLDDTFPEYAEKYFVARNLPEHDANWNSTDPKWIGKASMSNFHQFLLCKNLNWEYFNILGFTSDMLPELLEMKKVAVTYAKSCGITNPGLFFHHYPNNTIQAIHMHIINMDAVGPSYYYFMERNENLSIDIAIEAFQQLEEEFISSFQ